MDLRAISSSRVMGRVLVLFSSMSSLGRRAASGAFWSFAGSVVERGLLLATSVFMARFLGIVHFGELGIVQNTIGMFGTLAGFGLGLTATKYIAELRAHDSKRIGPIIALSNVVAGASGSIMSFILVLLAPWLAAQTLGAPHLGGALRVGSLLLLAKAMDGVQSGALVGFEAFRTVAWVKSVSAVCTFGLAMVGAYFYGLHGAVWGYAGASVLRWVISRNALQAEARRRGLSLQKVGCMEERSILWSFSVPAMLSAMMVGPVTWVGNALLVNQPDGFIEMGLYNAASHWRAIILFIPSSVGSIVLPLLSNMQGERRHRQFSKLLWFSVVFNGGVAAVSAIIVSALALPIMKSYGPGFENGHMTLVVSTASSVLMVVNSVIGQAIASRGRMWLGFLFNWLWALCFVILSCMLVPRQGSLGLAVASGISYALHSVWQLGYILIKRESD